MRKPSHSVTAEAICRRLQLIPKLPTLKAGERYLTIPKFCRLLALRGLRYSRSSLYTYQTMPLTSLPEPFKKLFIDQEGAWFISSKTNSKTQSLIPLRLFIPEIQKLAIQRDLSDQYHLISTEDLHAEIDEILAEARSRIYDLLTGKDTSHGNYPTRS